MATMIGVAPARQALAELLGGARQRVRLRLALRLIAITALAATVVVLLAAAVVRSTGFDAAWLTGARIVAWAVMLGVIVWMARPLIRRLDDRRMALYLEERDPSLDAALVSAVDAGRDPAHASPALAGRTMESAVTLARAHPAVAASDRESIMRWALAALGAVVLAVALLGFGPAPLRPAINAVLAPWSTDTDAVSYAIRVTPGNAEVPRGGDIEIVALLRNFTSDDVGLFVRRGAEGTGEWERLAMAAGADSGAHVLRLFDLSESMHYMVEASGVRSATYRLDVVDLPTVSRLDLELRHPPYTGLPVKRIEDGGDLAVPTGTTVIVRALVTRPVAEGGGRIVFEGMPPFAMKPDSGGTLVGAFKVLRDGFYHIELKTDDGRWRRATLDFLVDALDDQEPTVTIERPGRDERVSSLDEVLVEARAEDDYGIRSLEIVFSVNGGPDEVAALNIGRAGRDVNGTRTFFLEEMSLTAGDLVSYYARARDGGGRTGTSDIYFLRIRPFDQEYRMADQAAAPGGQQPDESPSVLTERQRQIVAATFNLVRDRSKYDDREWREHLATLALTQGRLREQVEQLVLRLKGRGAMALDSSFRAMGEALDTAATAMKEAEELLGRREARGALPPEQRALQQLQRAEAVFREIQVTMGAGQGGAGGAGTPPEDLADLFDLEVDRMRNQYETVQRNSQEQRTARVDETLEELRRLASRQQRENERLRRRMSEMARNAPASGGGGGGQRELAEQAEQAARQLERLARETQSREMEQAARELRESADAMRRSAAGGRDGGVAESQRALDRLREAQRLADRARARGVEESMRSAAERAGELVERQREIAAEAERARGTAGTERARRMQAVSAKKDGLASDVAELEERLEQLARGARGDAPDAARRLQETAADLRDKRVVDKIQYSKGVAQAASPEYARALEEQIEQNLEDARQSIEGAHGVARNDPGRRMGENLDRTRDLVRGLEGLEQRLREGAAAERRARREGETGGQREGQAGGQQPGEGRGGEAREGQQGEQPGQQPGGQGAGQTSEGGQASGPPSGAEPDAEGRTSSNSPTGIGSREGGPAPADTRRQLRREVRQRSADAEELRRALSREGVSVEELERLIGRLRALDDERVYSDQEEVDRLRRAIDEIKAFEFALRRTVEGVESERGVMGKDDEVPPAFRKMVEEYYKSLARGTKP